MALLQEKDNFTQKLNQGYFGTFYGSDPFFGSQGGTCGIFNLGSNEEHGIGNVCRFNLVPDAKSDRQTKTHQLNGPGSFN